MKKKKLNASLSAPTIQLKVGDNGLEKNIQILRVGEWDHPWYGKIKITKSKLKTMVKNFKNDVLRNELMLDFNHVVNEAGGWFTNVFTENDGEELWASIDYTRKGKSSIEDQEWKYISADFTENFRCPETKKEYGPTLYGAALTNRPFIKGMSKVALNENYMEEEMEEEIKELSTKVDGLVTAISGLVTQLSEKPATPTSTSTEPEAEGDTKLLNENKILKAKIARNEKETKFSEMVRSGKAVPAQKDAFLEGDMIKFAELAQPTKQEATGHAEGGEDQKFDDPQDEVLKLAEAKMEKEKIDFDAALHAVLEEKPELKKKIYG